MKYLILQLRTAVVHDAYWGIQRIVDEVEVESAQLQLDDLRPSVFPEWLHTRYFYVNIVNPAAPPRAFSPYEDPKKFVHLMPVGTNPLFQTIKEQLNTNGIMSHEESSA
jgi:hypothetical protein